MRRPPWWGVLGLVVGCTSLGRAFEPGDEPTAPPGHEAVIPFDDAPTEPSATRPTQARARTAALVAGGFHACLRHDDGTAACWGLGDFGQLGDGTLADRRTAVAVSGLDDVVQLAAGLEHTCARLGSGEVRCWGANAFGQLGDGTDAPGPTPRAVVGIDDATELQLGDFEACAIRRGGAIECWGGNLGGMPIALQPETSWRARPRREHHAGGWRQLAVTQEYRCLWGSGGAECWGSDDFDACPRGGGGDPARCPTAELADVVDVALASSVGCAVIRDGSIRCWGSASYGQTPTGGNACYLNYPEPGCPRALVGVAPAIQVAVGSWHACALHDDGRVRCWGTNNFGQVGTPRAETEALRWRDTVGPTVVDDWHDVVEIAAGRGFTCAHMADGEVACIGDFAEGRRPQLLTAPRPLQATDRPVGTPSTAGR